MSDQVFISYSHRDEEFVTRLASDLNAQVSGGVWFDRADLQAGQRWRDKIAAGILSCKAFVLVLSPDTLDSVEVHKELDQAVQANRTIIPILYRPVKSFGDLEQLVRSTQYIDLRAGSYADNFQKLVDGLLAAGVAAGASQPPPFLRAQAPTDWGAVWRKIPGWAAAWGLGWVVFWFVLGVIAWFGPRDGGSQSFASLLLAPLSGGLGGAAGGLAGGLIHHVCPAPQRPVHRLEAHGARNSHLGAGRIGFDPALCRRRRADACRFCAPGIRLPGRWHCRVPGRHFCLYPGAVHRLYPTSGHADILVGIGCLVSNRCFRRLAGSPSHPPPGAWHWPRGSILDGIRLGSGRHPGSVCVAGYSGWLDQAIRGFLNRQRLAYNS